MRTCQALAVLESGTKDDDERINPNGGAIAIGHPLELVEQELSKQLPLPKENKKYALIICVSVGQGYATIIERV